MRTNQSRAPAAKAAIPAKRNGRVGERGGVGRRAPRRGVGCFGDGRRDQRERKDPPPHPHASISFRYRSSVSRTARIACLASELRVSGGAYAIAASESKSASRAAI